MDVNSNIIFSQRKLLELTQIQLGGQSFYRKSHLMVADAKLEFMSDLLYNIYLLILHSLQMVLQIIKA